MANNNFQLHEDQMGGIRSRRPIDNTSGITKFIMSHSGGMIQTPGQASVVMVVMIILCIWGVFAFMPEETRELNPQRPDVVNGIQMEYPDDGPARAKQ